jgi:hypothetical protein
MCRYAVLFSLMVLISCAKVSPPVSVSTPNTEAPPEATAGLSPEYQRWIEESCPRSLGPSLWQSCVAREVAALQSGVPDISGSLPDTFINSFSIDI